MTSTDSSHLQQPLYVAEENMSDSEEEIALESDLETGLLSQRNMRRHGSEQLSTPSNVVVVDGMMVHMPGREGREIAHKKSFHKKSGFCKYQLIGGGKPYYNPVKTAYLLLMSNILFWFERPGEAHPKRALFLEQCVVHTSPRSLLSLDLVFRSAAYRLFFHNQKDRDHWLNLIGSSRMSAIALQRTRRRNQEDWRKFKVAYWSTFLTAAARVLSLVCVAHILLGEEFLWHQNAANVAANCLAHTCNTLALAALFLGPDALEEQVHDYLSDRAYRLQKGGQRHISTLSLRAAVRMRAFWVILVFESGSLLFGLDDWFLVFKTPSPEESFWLNFACLVAGMMFLAGSTTAFVTFWASAPREWSRYDTLKQAVGPAANIVAALGYSGSALCYLKSNNFGMLWGEVALIVANSSGFLACVASYRGLELAHRQRRKKEKYSQRCVNMFSGVVVAKIFAMRFRDSLKVRAAALIQNAFRAHLAYQGKAAKAIQYHWRAYKRVQCSGAQVIQQAVHKYIRDMTKRHREKSKVSRPPSHSASTVFKSRSVGALECSGSHSQAASQHSHKSSKSSREALRTEKQAGFVGRGERASKKRRRVADTSHTGAHANGTSTISKSAAVTKLQRAWRSAAAKKYKEKQHAAQAIQAAFRKSQLKSAKTLKFNQMERDYWAERHNQHHSHHHQHHQHHRAQRDHMKSSGNDTRSDNSVVSTRSSRSKKVKMAEKIAESKKAENLQTLLEQSNIVEDYCADSDSAGSVTQTEAEESASMSTRVTYDGPVDYQSEFTDCDDSGLEPSSFNLPSYLFNSQLTRRIETALQRQGLNFSEDSSRTTAGVGGSGVSPSRPIHRHTRRGG